MKQLVSIIVILAAVAIWWVQQDEDPNAKSGTGKTESSQPAAKPSSKGTPPKVVPANPTSTQKTPRKQTPTKDASAAKTGGRRVLVTLPNGHKEDVGPTLDRIAKGIKFPHRNDGSVFKNYERRLPQKARGYYREFVHPTPNRRGPGARRVVKGKRGEIYYTHDHYETFVKVDAK